MKNRNFEKFVNLIVFSQKWLKLFLWIFRNGKFLCHTMTLKKRHVQINSHFRVTRVRKYKQMQNIRKKFIFFQLWSRFFFKKCDSTTAEELFLNFFAIVVVLAFYDFKKRSSFWLNFLPEIMVSRKCPKNYQVCPEPIIDMN